LPFRRFPASRAPCDGICGRRCLRRRRRARPPTPPARAGAYDGTWNVTFATQAGNCSSTNSVPFHGGGPRVSSAGGGKVTGGISRGGSVSVNIGRRLVGERQRQARRQFRRRPVERDHYRRRCSGSWQATRS
jgi:hypothetical protein